MSATAKNLTFHPEILRLAEQLMELRHFGGNLSAFLSQLLREEWERRQSPMTFATTGAPVALQIAEELAGRHVDPPASPPPPGSGQRPVPCRKQSRANRVRSSLKDAAKVRKKK